MNKKIKLFAFILIFAVMFSFGLTSVLANTLPPLPYMPAPFPPAPLIMDPAFPFLLPPPPPIPFVVQVPRRTKPAYYYRYKKNYNPKPSCLLIGTVGCVPNN